VSTAKIVNVLPV